MCLTLAISYGRVLDDVEWRCISVGALFIVQEDVEWLEAAMVGNEGRVVNASPWLLRLKLSYNVKTQKDIMFKEIVDLVRPLARHCLTCPFSFDVGFPMLCAYTSVFRHKQ